MLSVGILTVCQLSFLLSEIVAIAASVASVVLVLVLVLVLLGVFAGVLCYIFRGRISRYFLIISK